MERRKILLDLRDINHPTCGFGQIALNYAKHFSEIQSDEVEFVFLLPEKCTKKFGSHVRTVNSRPKLNKYFSFTLPKVDLWHSIHQRQRRHRISCNGKYILTIHDLNFLIEKGRLSQLKHLFRLQRMINKADAITTISHYVAEQINQYFNLKGKQVQVIYNGVERIDNQSDMKPKFVTDKPFFFTIGQVRRKKNFHLLPNVMKSFPNYNLYICGEDHLDYADEIRNTIKEQDLKNVFLTGPIKQEEKIWLYRNCSAFLFPSKGEGFGLPVIEAMQFGKAVFVSNYTCLPEISGGHAFIWDKLDTESMVDTIRKELPCFYKDKERIEEEKKYAHSFSYERHIQSYFNLYLKVLGIK